MLSGRENVYVNGAILGLSKKEMAIYLSNLRVGSSAVQEIAKRAGINRTAAYDILTSLERKGFVSYTISSGKRYYQATKPERLLGLIKEREQLVKKAIPELQTISESTAERPKVEVYVGINGIKTVFEMILREAKEFRVMASKTQLSKLFKYYFPNFVKRRIQKGIKVRMITDAEPYDKKAPNKRIKKPIKTATWCYPNKIIMVSLEEKEPIAMHPASLI